VGAAFAATWQLVDIVVATHTLAVFVMAQSSRGMRQKN